MDPHPAQIEQVSTTTWSISQWVDTPTTVALVFALAGAVFLGIYGIRRIRRTRADLKR
jgi:hypothetical protein